MTAMSWLTAFQHSMLLDLPAELRERIFTFALVSEKPLVTFHLDEYQKEAYQEAVQPALLIVSRQIRQETIPIFYGCNNFIFSTDGRKAAEAQSWLDHAQPYLDILGGASFWLRHVNRVPSNISSSGALSVTMRWAARKEHWDVCPDWIWISPVRRPLDAALDGEYLTTTLQGLVEHNNRDVGVQFFVNIMSILRKSYIDHKAH